MGTISYEQALLLGCGITSATSLLLSVLSYRSAKLLGASASRTEKLSRSAGHAVEEIRKVAQFLDDRDVTARRREELVRVTTNLVQHFDARRIGSNSATNRVTSMEVRHAAASAADCDDQDVVLDAMRAAVRARRLALLNPEESFQEFLKEWLTLRGRYNNIEGRSDR